jgi:hypothetical protein
MSRSNSSYVASKSSTFFSAELTKAVIQGICLNLSVISGFRRDADEICPLWSIKQIYLNLFASSVDFA